MVQYRAAGLAASFGQVGRTQQRGGLGRQATGIGQGRQQSTGLGESGGEWGENSEQKGQSGDRGEKKSVFLLLSGYSHQPQTMVVRSGHGTTGTGRHSRCVERFASRPVPKTLANNPSPTIWPTS